MLKSVISPDYECGLQTRVALTEPVTLPVIEIPDVFKLQYSCQDLNKLKFITNLKIIVFTNYI